MKELTAQLAEAISVFECSDDKDIEDFLKIKAEQFESRGWCVECSDDIKVLDFYKNNGFKILQKDESDNLNQMYYKL